MSCQNDPVGGASTMQNFSPQNVGSTDDEQCQKDDECNNTQLFVVGEGVNAKTGGEPYLAGVITKIQGDDIQCVHAKRYH